MGLIKDEKLSYYGGLSKNHIFRGVHKKPIYKEELPKKMGLGQFADLRGAWKKRRGWCFSGGLIPHCAL